MRLCTKARAREKSVRLHFQEEPNLGASQGVSARASLNSFSLGGKKADGIG